MLTLVHIDNNNVALDGETCRHIRQKVGNRKLAVISICGKFRQGKSFLGNVIKKRLEDPESLRDLNGVIGGEDGIAFKRGQDAHTRGIHVWKDVFEVNINGEEIAVLLMDSQGTFDTCHNARVSAQVFCIASAISSSLIFNVKDMLSGQEIDALQLFVNCSQELEQKMGQNFYFLVRDFVPQNGVDHYLHGEDAEYLERVLDNTSHSSDLSSAISDLFSSFSSLKCFTSPVPPESVRHANGRIQIADCGQPFFDAIASFADHIVSNVPIKEVMGNVVNGDTYFAYLENIVNNVKRGRISEIRTAYESASRISVQEAFTCGMEEFNRLVAYYPRSDVNPSAYEKKLDEAMEEALRAYHSVSRMGRDQVLLKEEEEFREKITTRSSFLLTQHRSRYTYSAILGVAEQCREEYMVKITPSGIGRLSGDRQFDERHRGLVQEMVAKFDQESTQLLHGDWDTDGSAMEHIDQTKRQLLKGTEAVYLIFKGDNDATVILKRCRKEVDRCIEYYRARMNESLQSVGSAQELDAANAEAVTNTERVFDEEMREIREEYGTIPNIDELLEQCKEIDFARAIRLEQENMVSRGKTTITNKEMQRNIGDMTGTITNLQNEIKMASLDKKSFKIKIGDFIDWDFHF